MRRIAFTFFLIFGLLTLGGCISSSYNTIRGDDKSAASPLLRTSFPLSQREGGVRMQIAAAHQEGKFHDEVRGNPPAQINGTSFQGPTTLSAKASFTHTRVNVVFPFRLGRQGAVRGEATAGGAILDTQLRVSNATLTETLDERCYCANGGVAFIWMPPEQRFGLRGAADWTYAGSVSLWAHEMLATYALTPNVELLLGYRAMNYLSSPLYGSDIDVTLAGPAAGLHFRF